MSKMSEMIKWPERYKDLFHGTGLDLEELLAEAAQHVMQCDNCKMKQECCYVRITEPCRNMWLEYLKGGKDGKKENIKE